MQRTFRLTIGRGLDHYNDFRILPRTLRDELRGRFDEYFARKHNRDMRLVRQNIDSVFAEMDAADFSEELRKERIINFMHFINDLDKSRTLSFKVIRPDIYHAIVAYYGHWDMSTRYA